MSLKRTRTALSAVPNLHDVSAHLTKGPYLHVLWYSGGPCFPRKVSDDRQRALDFEGFLPGVIWCVIGRISFKKIDRRRYSALLSICLITRLSCSACWYCCLHRQNRWCGIFKMNCGVLCNYQVRILWYTPWRLLLLSKLCSMCSQLFDNFIRTINNQSRFVAWDIRLETFLCC